LYEVAVFRLTVDLECHEDPPSHAYLKTIHQLLDRLDEQRVRATFFVNGTALASESGRQSVKEISIRGHEIGSHGHEHVFIRSLEPNQFRKDLIRSKDELLEITGKLPLGYRAPYFSLTSEVPWVPELIETCGFKYSSSVFPARNPQAGYPSAPKIPFRWQGTSLIEFPVPIFGVGSFGLPLLGGGYFRLLPNSLVPLLRRVKLNRGDTWTYLHPYDLSPKIPAYAAESLPNVFRPLISVRRKNSIDRYLRLVSEESSTLGDLASSMELFRGLTDWRHPREGL